LVSLAVVAWATAAWAHGQSDRPSEQEMFGGGGGATPAPPPAPGPAAPAPPAPAPPAPLPSAPPEAPVPPAAAGEGTARDQALLGNSSGEVQHLSDYVAPDNPLQIGGQVYLRAQTTAYQGQKPADWSLSAPDLIDAYFDGRPNPRVRAFVLGRVGFDPTLPPNLAPSAVGLAGGGALSAGSATGFSTFSNTRGPTTVLDQMWIRFDVLETVFITAGKQHNHWGTGRFWQPTDYLHPIKRNPLDVFDARPGTSMVKLHVPWEDRGWNFYGYGVFEDPNNPTPTLRQVAGALRAELVLAGVEVGLDTYLQKDHNPRYGIDLSSGIGDFDVYADVGIQPGSNFVHYFATPQPEINTFSGYETQAVGGINYSRRYNDNDMWTAGVEYFYNNAGYSSASSYADAISCVASASNPLLGLPPCSINTPLSSPFAVLPFFYLGRHYGAVFISLPAPYSWNYTTFTLSTLGNLSDGSYISRLDYAVTILTHLSLEAFIGVHYGNGGGEFRFKLPDNLQPLLSAATNRPTPNAYPVLDLGVALRLKI
jgi:hypothetical protein